MERELSVEFTFCSLDHRPIDDSPAYRALLLCGKEVADFFTYVDTVPIISRHPPPESDEVGRPPRADDKAS